MRFRANLKIFSAKTCSFLTFFVLLQQEDNCSKKHDFDKIFATVNFQRLLVCTALHNRVGVEVLLV